MQDLPRDDQQGTLSLSRRTGGLVLLLALLVTLASYLLQTRLDFPAILLDSASFASALVAQGAWAGLLGFAVFLLCAGLVLLISLRLATGLDERRRQHLVHIGSACAIAWTAGALPGLLLVPVWGHLPAMIAQLLALQILVTLEFVIPLMLISWTMTLARQFHAHKVVGWISVIGLMLTAGRTVLWVLDAFLSIEATFYAISGMIDLFVLLTSAVWLFWLVLFGFHLLYLPSGPREPQPAVTAEHHHRHAARRALLRSGLHVGVSVLGLGFVAARTSLTVATQPDPESDDLPSEPSLIAMLFYASAWVYLKLVNPMHTIAQQRVVTAVRIAPVPKDIFIEQVDAGGVPAQRIRAPGAGSTHWILYVHGGGFAEAGTNESRAFVGRLSRQTGASALYPDYRLTPEHPFPAGLNDCLTAYRWLLSQGVAASHIALAGESAGANLAIATALALKERGEALPAAVVVFSPPTDMTMSGESYRTKAIVDPILGSGLAQDAFDLYTNHGKTDPRNPLVSPLYADLRGFPPTLLQVGTLEVLLSDSLQMAERLKAARVETKLEVWRGMMHAFTSGTDSIPEARLATRHAVKFLLRHWGRR